MTARSAFAVGVLAMVTAAMSAAVACAQSAPQPILISLERLPSDAQKPVVRVTTRVLDCSAAPTISIVAEWTERRRYLPTRLRIGRLTGVIATRPAAERLGDDVLRFARVTRKHGRARLEATVVADWRARPHAAGCRLTLPALVAPAAADSQAIRGVNRLASAIAVTRPSRRPERTTGRERVWTCGDGGPEDCRVDITLGSIAASTGPSRTHRNDLAGVLALLVLAGLLAGLVTAAARHPRPRGGVMKTWEELANEALSDAREPITANATDLTKFGVPATAIATVLLTGLLGIALDLDASRGDVVVAASIVLAAIMLGVYHAIASDIRTRGAVTIARIERLGDLASEAMRRDTALAEDRAELIAAKEAAERELAVAQAQLTECREARKAAADLRARWRPEPRGD